MRTPKAFARALSEVRLPNVFNPYPDRCAVYDLADAAHLRKRNLERCLEAALAARVDTVWIARDLGYRGGRRTGIALTDEVHLEQAEALLGGISLKRATHGPLVAERTAAVIWSVLVKIGKPVVLWNVFPLHPHEPGDPLSNRCHTRDEREAARPFLEALIEMFRPKRLLAIGRDAAGALVGTGVPVELVRHPSYGGQTEFVTGVHSIYRIPAVSERFDLFTQRLTGS